MQRRRRTRSGPITRNEFDIQMAHFSALTRERYEAEAELRRQWNDSYERRRAKERADDERREAEHERRAAEFRATLAEWKAENDRRHQEHRDNLAADIENQKHERAQWRADFQAIKNEMAELRKDFRSLKWNIWFAACGTIIGLASLNAAMSSNILSAFESGRNSAVSRVTPWQILFGFDRETIDETRPPLP
ncbi:hypothetical protein [Cupriavidus sp. SW-Y-13]|uniref:hypothetical protein n=1 Tax=Cupriavidus sp. SW-Y-13 TaxID=2653854 RepID=UPI0013667B82|nr:hypothetical protein [Cupriavidus sp. SW-Y-13]MWL87856.1 hypothetical protein [Cupriavidus sp. SW-Y-13]